MRNYGKVVHQDSGAFKTVTIYEYAVYKEATENEYEKNYLNYSEAEQMSNFHDENNVFHPSWVDEYNENNGQDMEQAPYEDCIREMETEYEFVKKFQHLDIIVPIIEGYYDGYFMRRAKTEDELEDNIPELLRKKKEKEVKVKVAALFRKRGEKVLLGTLNYRIEKIIHFGIRAKLSADTIARDVFYFLHLDEKHNILSDMHSRNLGIYRGHVVTFDAGQTSEDYYYSGGRSARECSNLDHINNLKREAERVSEDRKNKYYNLLSNAIKNKLTVKAYNNDKEILFTPLKLCHSWNGDLMVSGSKCEHIIVKDWVSFETVKEK